MSSEILSGVSIVIVYNRIRIRFIILKAISENQKIANILWRINNLVDFRIKTQFDSDMCIPNNLSPSNFDNCLSKYFIPIDNSH